MESKMASINWDFAVQRHKETLTRIAFEDSKEAANARADALALPAAFKQRVIRSVKGEDVNGTPY